MATSAHHTRDRRFRVVVRSVDYPYVDLVARDEDDAREIAEHVDGGYFQSDLWGASAWEIDQIIEIPPDQPFTPLDKRYYDTL